MDAQAGRFGVLEQVAVPGQRKKLKESVAALLKISGNPSERRIAIDENYYSSTLTPGTTPVIRRGDATK